MTMDRAGQNAECVQLRELLLTADPAELRGEGDTAIARHVRTCERCADAAQRILGATALLAARQSALAVGAARVSRITDHGSRITEQRRKSVAESPAWWALPIAAVLATVMIASTSGEPEVLPRVGSLEDVKRPVSVPVVNAPANRDVAVFQTTENITVVWDLGAKGGS
jgi:hypothetical protein